MAQQRIQIREGLVEQQQLGLGGQGTGQRHALLLSARQVMRRAIGIALQAHHLERFAGAAFFVGHVGVVAEAEHHVFDHAQMRKERVVLKDESDAAALGRYVSVVVSQDAIAHYNGSGRETLESGNAAQHCGFAASAGPEHGEDFPIGHLKRDLVDRERPLGGVRLRDGINRKNRVSHTQRTARRGHAAMQKENGQ